MTAYRDQPGEDIVLRVRANGNAETFTLGASSLSYEWKSDVSSGKQSWSLDELAPHIERRSGKAGVSTDRAGWAFGFVGLAIVFRFSAVNDYVPLLAPFLFLVGAVFFMTFVRGRRSMEISVIARKNGDAVRWIDHAGCNPEKLVEFEEAFRARMRADA